MPMMAPATDLIGSILNHNSSGTTAEPPSTPMPMITTMHGPWMFMIHGNAFLADTVHIIGRRRWNKRGAMVTDRYQHVVHHETVESFAAWAEGEDLPVVAVDNVEGAVPVDRADLPQRCVLLFGQEGPGLSEAALAAASAHIEITQYGSTRSINASAAAAVIMYEWCRRYAD